MSKVWHGVSWEQYLYWQEENRKMAKKINALIKDIERNRYGGIGKNEPLKGNFSGWWSKRIDNEHRLVYKIENEEIHILSCKGHYE